MAGLADQVNARHEHAAVAIKATEHVAVEALGIGCAPFIAQAQVKRQPTCCLPIVLDVKRRLRGLVGHVRAGGDAGGVDVEKAEKHRSQAVALRGVRVEYVACSHGRAEVEVATGVIRLEEGVEEDAFFKAELQVVGTLEPRELAIDKPLGIGLDRVRAAAVGEAQGLIAVVKADVGEVHFIEIGIVDQDGWKADRGRVHGTRRGLRVILAHHRDTIHPQQGWSGVPVMFQHEIARAGLVLGRLKKVGIRVIALAALMTVTRVQATFGAEVVIDADVELVPVTRIDNFGREVAKSFYVAGLIGLRVQIHHLCPNRVPKTTRNEVSKERSASAVSVDAGAGAGHRRGRGVVKLPAIGEQLGEIAVPLGGGWDRGGDGVGRVVASPFIIEEEEGLLPKDRPADGTTVLVVPVSALGRAGGIGEEVVGVQARAAHEIPAGTMILIGAGFGDDVDDRAAVTAVLGGIAVVLDGEFLDRFYRRLVAAIGRAAFPTFGRAGQRAVEPDLGRRKALAVGGKVRAARAVDVATGNFRDPGRQVSQFGDVAVLQRQVNEVSPGHL